MTRAMARPERELVRALAAFAVLVAAVAGLWRHNGLLAAVALGGCALALVIWHDPLDVAFFLVIGVLGSAAEVVFVHFGVWRYANPSFLGVPLWFPLAFGTTGLTGSRLARALATMWEGRGDANHQ